MVKKYTYKIIIVGFIFIGAAFYSRTVWAADINVVASSQAGVYDVVLSLVPNESINAVEGTILFNEDATVVPSIETKDSIIPLWVKNPFVSGNSINFSGIIPGGFSVMYDQFGGSPEMEGRLFSIVFPFTANASSYTFTFDSTFVYLNDGLGTAVVISPKSITLPASASQNNFSTNNSIVVTPVSNSSRPFNLLIIFIVCVIIFLLVFFYWVKKKYDSNKKDIKK